MSNLKKETLSVLFVYGYAPEDVDQVQGKNVRISWDRFLELADVEYDGEHGARMVAMDLTILLKDGSWFTRNGCDGREWWELHRHPARAEDLGDDKVSSLLCRPGYSWCTLEEINSP